MMAKLHTVAPMSKLCQCVVHLEGLHNGATQCQCWRVLFNIDDILKSSNVKRLFMLPSGGSNKLAWIHSKYLQDPLWPKPVRIGTKSKSTLICDAQTATVHLTCRQLDLVQIKLQNPRPCEGFPPLSAWARAPRENPRGFVQPKTRRLFEVFQGFSFLGIFVAIFTSHSWSSASSLCQSWSNGTKNLAPIPNPKCPGPNPKCPRHG